MTFKARRTGVEATAAGRVLKHESRAGEDARHGMWLNVHEAASDDDAWPLLVIADGEVAEKLAELPVGSSVTVNGAMELNERHAAGELRREWVFKASSVGIRDYITRVSFGDEKYVVAAESEDAARLLALRRALVDMLNGDLGAEVYDIRPSPPSAAHLQLKRGMEDEG